MSDDTEDPVRGSTPLKFTSKKWNGTLRGRKVIANGIAECIIGVKKYKANELCWVTFIEPQKRDSKVAPIYLSRLIEKEEEK